MIRVLSINLQRGLSREGLRTSSEELAAAFAGFADGDVNVVAMQEVNRGQPRSGEIDQARVVADALGLEHVRFAATLSGDVRLGRATPTDRWGAVEGPAYGLAIASRWPVAAWFVRPLPRLRTPYPVLKARRLALRDDEQRAVLAAVLRTPSAELSVGSAHLSLLAPVAARQVRVLLRAMAQLPRPTVVCGDLDLDPWLLRRFARGWELPRSLTFPTSSPRRQLDHVLVRGARVVGVEARELPISDHLGLLVTLDHD